MTLAVSDRDHIQWVLAEQSRLIELVQSGASLSDYFSELAVTAEKLLPGVRAAVISTDERRRSIADVHSVSLPQALKDCFRGLPISAAPFGTCGAAIFHGKPATCSDTANDLYWARAWCDSMEGFGVRACHSTPVLTPDRTAVGAFLLSFPAPHTPDARELAVGELGARMAGLAIERDRKSKTICEDQQRFLAIDLASSDVIFELTPDGRTVRRLYGRNLPCKREDINGDWLKQFLDPADREMVWNAGQAAIREKRFFELEHRVRRYDGSTGWVHTRAQPLFDPAGELSGWFGTSTDITECKLGAEALMRAERLAATGRMAAVVAHEINNPLESIANLLYLADAEGSMSPSAKDYIAKAVEELGRASHIVKQTLGFYRGSGTLAWIDVSTVASDLMKTYKMKAQGRNLTIEKDEAARIYAPSGEFRQVLSNLLSNAIDATDAQRGCISLRIRARNGFKSDGSVQPGVRITIADNGGGIDGGRRDKVFDAFFTTKRDVGTGLGLWVARTILRKHDAGIRLRTSVRPDRSGTVFSIFWPRITT